MEIISHPFQIVTFTVRVQSYAQSKQANDLSLKHKPHVQKYSLIPEFRSFST